MPSSAKSFGICASWLDSEAASQGELDQARIRARRADDAEGIWHIPRRSRIPEMRMIEAVEELHAELQRLLFTDLRRSGQSNVRIKLTGPEKDARS